MELTINLPKLHPGQSAVVKRESRFNVLSCGRRWGKTRLGTWEIIRESFSGPGRQSWWVAPSYPLAAVAWRGLKRICVQIPKTKIREVEKMIEFPNGSWAQVRSGDDPDSLRGEGLDLVVLDECAFMKEECWHEALRPAVADRHGRGIFIGTPKGRNWFWRLWQRGESGESGWASWKLPSEDNPFLDPEEIAKAKAEMSERVFRQEFLADFLEDGGGVFRNVLASATAEAEESPDPQGNYVIGVDWGRASDFTCFVVINQDTKSVAWLDRSNQVEYAIQRQRLLALSERFRPRTILAEANAMGEPIIEELKRDGLPVRPFVTTNATKAQVIDSLALAFERGSLRILSDPVLMSELDAYESERLPSGLIRYGAPSGMHDDTVIALALAHEAAFGGRHWDPGGRMAH